MGISSTVLRCVKASCWYQRLRAWDRRLSLRAQSTDDLHAHAKPTDSASILLTLCTDGRSQYSSTVVLSSQLMGAFCIYNGSVANLEDKIPFGGVSILIYLCSHSSHRMIKNHQFYFSVIPEHSVKCFCPSLHPKRKKKQEKKRKTRCEH